VTRDKGKWTQTPDDPLYSGKLLLPSFGINGIKVTRSAPRSEVYLAGKGTEDLTFDSGDAYSISYLGTRLETTTADRRFMGLDQAYIRRVLLRVLDGEEYDEVEMHYIARDPWELKPDEREGPFDLGFRKRVEDPDPKAQVRITDLRLAKDLSRPKDPERALNTDVSGLHLPVTTDNVLRWKWKTLRKPKGMREVSEVMESEEWYEEECLRISAISFAAAALCLSIDLDQENLEESSHNDLIEKILLWYRLISDLISILDKTIDEASKLLSGRKGTKGGRPPDPEFKSYTALVLYRMGHFPDDIARRIGISAPNPPEGSEAGTEHEGFNDNWKSGLNRAIKKGVEKEQENFPLAAEVFARRDEKKVRNAALAHYDEYTDRYVWWPQHVTDALDDGDDLLGMPADDTEQIRAALIQLGSCIKKGLDALSPDLG
jgi:hypothetical protein